jgi:HSP20 family protein
MKIIPRRRYALPVDWQRPFEWMRSFMEREFEPRFNAEHVLGTTPLALDVVDKNGDIVVKTTIPGVNEEEIDISYDNGVLTVQAESKTEKEEKEDDWYLHELRFGKFSRSVRLPVDVKVDRAEAVLEKGVLIVTLPKKEVTPTQRIAVKAKELLTHKKG